MDSVDTVRDMRSSIRNWFWPTWNGYEAQGQSAEIRQERPRKPSPRCSFWINLGLT